jgi:hypothetical protein
MMTKTKAGGYVQGDKIEEESNDEEKDRKEDQKVDDVGKVPKIGA